MSICIGEGVVNHTSDPMQNKSDSSRGKLWWQPHTKERTVSFLGACTKNYLLFSSPSAPNPFYTLLCPTPCLKSFLLQTASPGTFAQCFPRVWAKDGIYRRLYVGKREGSSVHSPISFLSHHSSGSGSIVYGKRAVPSSLALTLQVPGMPLPPHVLWGSGVVIGFCCCSSPSTSTSLNGSLNPVSSLNSLCLNFF